MPIAKVNDLTLTTKQFASDLLEQLRGLDPMAAKNPINVKKAKRSVLGAFINRAIVQSWADQNAISVTPAEVDAEVSAIRAQYPDDLSLRQSLADRNLSFEEWRTSLRHLILERKVSSLVTAKTTSPTEEELKNYYLVHKEEFRHKAQARLRQIVVSQQSDAERLYREALKSKNLTELARKFSITPEGRRGGDLGWVDRGTLEAFDAAFEGSRTGLLKVQKSPYGFHVIEVLERRPEGYLNFEQVKPRLMVQLKADRSQELFEAWLGERKQKARVSVNDKLVDAIGVHTSE